MDLVRNELRAAMDEVTKVCCFLVGAEYASGKKMGIEEHVGNIMLHIGRAEKALYEEVEEK